MYATVCSRTKYPKRLVSMTVLISISNDLLDNFNDLNPEQLGKLHQDRKAGIAPLVEYNEKKIFEVKLKGMKSALTTQIAEEADI